MGTYKRLPRQKLKRTDEFVTWTQASYHWVELNWRAVIAGIAGIAVISAVVILVATYAGGRDENARELLYVAEKISLQGGPAEAEFEKVLAKYPRSGAAFVARLKLSDIYFAKGDYKKAEDVLKPSLSAKKPEIRILGLHNMAAIKIASGDAKGGALLYLKAYEDHGNRVKGLSYFNAALALEKAGEVMQAKKIFEELSKGDEKNSDPDIREKSIEHLIWLSSRANS